jgi:hypothetical protein
MLSAFQVFKGMKNQEEHRKGSDFQNGNIKKAYEKESNSMLESVCKEDGI